MSWGFKLTFAILPKKTNKRQKGQRKGKMEKWKIEEVEKEKEKEKEKEQ